MDQLSLEQIDDLENFILNNNSHDSPAISPHHQEMQRETLSKVKNGPNRSYKVFGGNGFSSYAYYKAENGKIYLITSFTGELTSYSIIA
jgi:hypothetical protein